MALLNEYEDDCEVCRAEREARERGEILSFEEFKQALRRQRATGIGKVFIAGEDSWDDLF